MECSGDMPVKFTIRNYSNRIYFIDVIKKEDKGPDGTDFCLLYTLTYLNDGVLHLVMVLHQLDDDPDVVGVVLDGDNPHDVGGVLGVGILAVFVR